jgi:glycosyltransferase involved in cell wall biosynthesis
MSDPDCGHSISIVITNYNYGPYVGHAIESAIEVRHPRHQKQIIVCDDGSTDNSREVIERYRGEIDLILYQENTGQPSAANNAFRHVTGDIVFFLDSDDMYLPETAEKVLAVWHPGVSKVQFPMLNVDKNGVSVGTMFPKFKEALSPAQIRTVLLETGLYPTPPTTGNASSREFLVKIFPVPEDETVGFDSFINPTAPLYGEVLTILEPLAKYRVHGKNSWAQENFDPRRLIYYIKQDFLRTDYLRRHCDKLGIRIRANPLNHNTSHLMVRVGCKRMVPSDEYPLKGETLPSVMKLACRAIWSQEDTPVMQKTLLTTFFFGVGLMPKSIAMYFLRLRFVAISRPRFVTAMLRLIGARAVL